MTALLLADSEAMAAAGAVVVALAVDRFLGEPPARLHPVVWIGRYLGWIGPRVAPDASAMGRAVDLQSLRKGLLAWTFGAAVVVVAMLGLQGLLASAPAWLAMLTTGLLLKPLFAWRMLREEVESVESALSHSLASGRERLARLVSRDVSGLTAPEVRESAVETLAENLNDSVVAPLFWFAVAGLPGAALYRFANTADAMWGYRDMRQGRYWEWAGKAAARADDLLSWLPARLTALALAIAAGGLSWPRLRREAAQLLGFANYAEYALQTRMAKTVPEVMEFLNDLARRARPAAQKDFEELKQFAREAHGIGHLEAWDIAYYSEKLQQAKYRISQEDLRPYFPENKVVPGLFEVVERLYGLMITEIKGMEVWHPDVRFYEIRDSAGEVRGRFYMDLYARAHKRGGAWMDECINRKRTAAGVQVPVAYLVCNFTPPVGGKPALFTHDEVTTLFHEFGHGLHHMLTLVDYSGVAGINGVKWDAVELPSQFMENWCWERQALDVLARHYQSGAPLPDELYRKMIAARNFQSAMQMVRQLEFSLFDMRLYSDYDPNGPKTILQLLDEVRQEVSVLFPPAFNRFPNSFSHIFPGGYAAGYYSYKWAEVLSADAYAAFEEVVPDVGTVLDAKTGERFWREILAVGGSRPAIESFKAFRGREPSPDALLRHNGMVATA